MIAQLNLAMDTTLLYPLAEICHLESPGTDVVAVRPRMTEKSVELRGDRAALRNGLGRLRERIRAWALDAGVVRLRGTGAWEANMLRRALLTRLEVVAVDRVTIEENTTGTPDEVIAHRLGQVALRGDASMTGHLEHRRAEEVLSGCIDCVGGSVVDKNVVLAKPGSLRLTFTCTSGRASAHGKFAAVASPAVLPHWRLRGASSSLQALQDLSCEVRDLEARGDLATCTTTLDRAVLVDLLCLHNLAIDIDEKAEDFDLYIESLGQYDDEVCLEKARDALLMELHDIEARLALDGGVGA